MAARIVNLADPDDDGALCASEDEARQALETMIERFELQGYTGTEQKLADENEAQYKVDDPDDAWIATYTIIL